jgi:transposase
MRAMTDQSRAEFEKVIQTRQQQWKEYSEGIELELERQKNMTEKYKADLQSTTDLTEKTMETQQKQEADFMKHMREMMQMLQNAENDRMERQAKITDWIEQNGSDRIKSFAKSLH